MKTNFALGLLAISTALWVGAGCASPTSPGDEGTEGAVSDLAASSGGIMCAGLGVNEPELMQETATTLTLTHRGGLVERGDKVADPAAGFSGYRIRSSNSSMTVWLAKDGTRAELHEENVGPAWTTTCHKATAAELSADACALTLRDMGVGSRPPKVEKASPNEYTLTSTSSATGDYVWSAQTKGSGFFCGVISTTPVSCAAVVYDKIGDTARDDGSSSGSPFVNRGHAGFTWTGGIHDVESGEFAYQVVTSSYDDGCKVLSIKSTTN